MQCDGDDVPFSAEIYRVTDGEDAPRLGRAFAGRVVSIDPHLGGAFVDIGLKRDGFMPFKKGVPPKGMTQGALIRVEIAAEPYGDKGARVRRLPGTPRGDIGPDSGLDAGPDFGPAIGQNAGQRGEADLHPQDAITGPAAHAMADRALEEATSVVVPLPGGGDMAIEPTRALTAVDIDSGEASQTQGPGRFAQKLNALAADELARHIALRRLGGLIVVDFLTLRDPSARKTLTTTLQYACTRRDVKADVSPLSRNGLCEIVVPRGRTPIHELLGCIKGQWSTQSCAFHALRRLRREGEAARGARLELTVAPMVYAWLETAPFDWQDMLGQHLGARFAVKAADDVDRMAPVVRCVGP